MAPTPSLAIPTPANKHGVHRSIIEVNYVIGPPGTGGPPGMKGMTGMKGTKGDVGEYYL